MNKIESRWKLSRVLAFTLALLLSITLLPVSGSMATPVQGAAADISKVVVGTGLTPTPDGSGGVTITGSYSGAGIGIHVKDGYNGTITLNGVDVTSTGAAPMFVAGKPSFAPDSGATAIRDEHLSNKVIVQLKGSNRLYTNRGTSAGLETQYGSQITLIDADGTGSLTATGGDNSAGIGAGNDTANRHVGYSIDGTRVRDAHGGNIIIRSGNITATGGYHGSGIGGGHNASFESIIVVYADADVSSQGGAHGAGIGGGCNNSYTGGTGMNSAVVALLAPDGASVPKITSSGAYGPIGKVTFDIFIGDPTTNKITVKTEENTPNAKMFMNLTVVQKTDFQGRTAKLSDVLARTDVPLKIKATDANVGRDGINLPEFQIGTTRANGDPAEIHMLPTSYNINFFTDSKTTKNDFFIPQEFKVTGHKDVVLENPRYELTVESGGAAIPNLQYGYTTVPAGNNQTVKVKNTGNADILIQQADLEAQYGKTFEITQKPDLTGSIVPGEGKPAVVGYLIKKGDTVEFKIQPKLGLPVGDHKAKVIVKGSGVNIYGDLIPMDDVSFETHLQKVIKGGAGHGGLDAAAAPNKGLINIANNNVDLSILMGSEDYANAKIFYQISESQTTPGGSWVAFDANKTDAAVKFLESHSAADGSSKDYYIHWKFENDNIEETKGHFGVYNVDVVAPKQDGFVAPDTVNEKTFTVEVKFKEPVEGLTAGSFDAKGATVGKVTPKSGTGPDTVYIVELTPNKTGDISLKLKEGGAKDPAGNPNAPSAAGSGDELNISFNDDKPYAEFKFDTAAPMLVAPDEVVVELFPNGTDGKLYLPGTNKEITSGDLGSILEIGAPGGTSWVPTGTITYDSANEKYIVTVKPPAGKTFDDGDFTIKVKPDAVENSEKSGVLPGNGKFTVNVPTDINSFTDSTFIVNPREVPYTGGTVNVTMKGVYLNKADYKVQVTVEKNEGGSWSTAETFILDKGSLKDGNKTLAFTHPVGANNNNYEYRFTYKPMVGSTVSTAALTQNTATQKAATPTIDPGAGGFSINPNLVDFKGGNPVITIKGENLHNFGQMTVERTNPDGTKTILTVPKVTTPGKQTVTVNDLIGKNPDNSVKDYVYTLKGQDGTVLGTTGLKQTEAKPSVDDFVIVPGGNTGTGTEKDPIIISKDGGGDNLIGKIEGENLDNFHPMEIVVTNKNDGTKETITIKPGDITGEHKTDFETLIKFPPNPGRDDIVYEVELKVNGGNSLQPPKKVIVVVEGSKPKVSGVETDQDRHWTEHPGTATSELTVGGKFLDNFDTLEVVDELTGKKYPVTVDPASRGKGTTTVDLERTDQWRNDIHELYVYADGQKTEHFVTIEVGPSNPRVRKATADKNYFADVDDTLKGKGVVNIKIHGDYMGRFDSLQVYDELYKKYIDVPLNPDIDMEVTASVTVPSVRGIFKYEIWADGEFTGKYVEIKIGGKAPVILGDSGDPLEEYEGDPEWNWGEEDDEDFPGRPGDKDKNPPRNNDFTTDGDKIGQWAASGGGNKGRGGGDHVSGNFGFDVLQYQSEQTGKVDPKNPIIVLRNVDFITRGQIDLAVAGANKGIRASEKSGKGSLVLVFDSTSLQDPTKLEGRLYVDTTNPLPDLYTGVFTSEEETKATQALFASQFGNDNVHVVSLGHNGSYSSTVEVAAMVADLADRAKEDDYDEETLVVTRMDRETGEFEMVVKPEAYVDEAGYVHFETKKGGDIVITEGPLMKDGAPVLEGNLKEMSSTVEAE